MKILHYIYVFVLIIALGALYAGATGCSVGVEPATNSVAGGDGTDGTSGDDGGDGTVILGTSRALTATPGNGQITLNWADDGVYDLYIIGPIDTADASYDAIADEMLAIYNMSEGEIDPEQIQVLIDNGVNVAVEMVTGTSYLHTATNDMAYFFILSEHVDASASVSKANIAVGVAGGIDGAVAMNDLAYVVVLDSTAMNVSWAAKPAAHRYRITRFEQGGDQVELGEIDRTFIDDSNLQNGIPYVYEAVPCWDPPWWDLTGESKCVLLNDVEGIPLITLGDPFGFSGDGEEEYAAVGTFQDNVFTREYQRAIVTSDADMTLRSYDEVDGSAGPTHAMVGVRPNIAIDEATNTVLYTSALGGADMVLCALDAETMNFKAGFGAGAGCTNSIAGTRAEVVKVLSNGNYIVAGNQPTNFSDFMVRIYSPDGVELAAGSRDGVGRIDNATDIVEMDDGYIAVGISDAVAAFDPQTLLVKFDLALNPIAFLAPGGEGAFKAMRTLDDKVAVLYDDNDIFVVEGDLSAATASVIPGMSARVNDIILDDLDRLIAVGRTLEFVGPVIHSHSTLWIMERDADNYVLDTMNDLAEQGGELESVARGPNDSIIAVGSSSGGSKIFQF